jgi:membrane protein involved in colicin uptake
MQSNIVTQPFVTSLNAIREHKPCTKGWTKLLKHLKKTQADDEELNLLTVLESNGLDDALWCLRAVKGQDKAIRLYAVWCARQVQHLMKDQRSLDALDMAEKFAKGEATEQELEDASNSAYDSAHTANTARDAAANAAAYAAYGAAYGAARDAAYGAAYGAARDAANSSYAAARGAAYSAAYSANSAAARASAKAKQKQELILVLNGKYS